MRTRIPVLTGLVLAIALIFVSCVDEDDDGSEQFTASAHFAHSIGVTTQTAFELSGVNGEVDITGVTDEDSVRIYGERIVRSNISQADADGQLALLLVSLNTTTALISVATEQPDDSDGRTYIVDYGISMPPNMTVTVTNVNGNVSAQALEGEVNVSIVNGSLEFLDIAGALLGQAINGNVFCRTLGHTRVNSALQTVNGDVTIEFRPGIQETAVEAHVVNGVINMLYLVFWNPVHTDTSFTGILGGTEERAHVFLSTVNGNINGIGISD